MPEPLSRKVGAPYGASDKGQVAEVQVTQLDRHEDELLAVLPLPGKSSSPHADIRRYAGGSITTDRASRPMAATLQTAAATTDDILAVVDRGIMLTATEPDVSALRRRLAILNSAAPIALLGAGQALGLPSRIVPMSRTTRCRRCTTP